MIALKQSCSQVLKHCSASRPHNLDGTDNFTLAAFVPYDRPDGVCREISEPTGRFASSTLTD
jgi:hypothetical protein